MSDDIDNRIKQNETKMKNPDIITTQLTSGRQALTRLHLAHLMSEQEARWNRLGISASQWESVFLNLKSFLRPLVHPSPVMSCNEMCPREKGLNEGTFSLQLQCHLEALLQVCVQESNDRLHRFDLVRFLGSSRRIGSSSHVF